MASTRVSGMVTPGAVVGLEGGIHSGLGLSDVALMDLRGKELGHVHNIIFWNNIQQDVFRGDRRRSPDKSQYSV